MEKDRKEAVRWYWQAAEQGHAGVQYELGKCYRYGYGVNKKFIVIHNIILFFLCRCAILIMVEYTGGLVMTYNYDKLWKLLIDRKMTKTEMRIQAGISTNMLAKMGKEEPVTMETLAKICTALNCGLDDIVEIQKGRQNND